MKKIVMMLLGVAATINVMAVDYTAKAIVTLQSESGYNCKLTLRQAAEYGALNGLEMNMEGRFVALYALNGSTKLQTAQAADFTDVKLGLLTDASTNYTITVSSVAGSETLYLYDGADKAYALTEGASYNFTATASSTDEARFVIKKTPLPAGPEFCFNNEELKVNGFAGKKLAIWNADKTTAIVPEFTLGETFTHNFSAEPKSKFIIVFDGLPADAPVQKEYVIDVKPEVKKVNP